MILYQISSKLHRFTALPQSQQWRYASTQTVPSSVSKMRACRIYRYGTLDEMEVSDTLTPPIVTSPDTVIVKVHAASLNPIDLWMVGGYGSPTFNLARETFLGRSIEFPLILGRDFSGVVESVGQEASKRFRVGQSVMGALWPYQQGSLADYVSISSCSAITHKPNNVTHVEAAGIPYSGLTAFTAILEVAQTLNSMCRRLGLQKERVLVHGATGGVGCMAVQLARCHGASHITATCQRENAVEFLEQLGADAVIGDTSDASKFHPEGYNLILDCVGNAELLLSPLLASSTRSLSRYVTLTLPLISNIDQYGLPGLPLSVFQLANKATQAILKPRFTTSDQPSYAYRWSLFRSSGPNLSAIADLVNAGELKPVVDKVFPLNQVKDAFTHLQKGPKRGKTVVTMNGD